MLVGFTRHDIIYLLFIFYLKSASGELVSALLLPHGGALFDPDLVASENSGSCTSNGCDATAQGRCQACGRELKAAAEKAVTEITGTNPDLVVLTTPHSAYEIAGKNIVYAGEKDLQGSMGGQTIQARTSNQSAALLNHLLTNGVPAELSSLGISALRWAELIPISFLPSSLHQKMILIAISYGSKNASCSFGNALRSWADGVSEKVLWLVSGDMSHYHGMEHAGCSDSSTAPYASVFPDSTAFETDIQCWASDNLNSDDRKEDLRTAGLLNAGSCGLSGLQALACGLSTDSWTGCVLGHAACTYFGMMVAGWTRSGFSAAAQCLGCAKRSAAASRYGASVTSDDQHGEMIHRHRDSPSFNFEHSFLRVEAAGGFS